MIHVTSVRMTPVAAIENNDTTPTSNEVAAKRLLKKVGVTVVVSAAALAGAITLANRLENETTPVAV